jgi:hypothetical protein
MSFVDTTRIPIQFTYVLSPAFMQYLERERPGVAAVLKKNGVRQAQVTTNLNGLGETGRYILAFPGINPDEAGEFDRTLGADAVIVLDYHPERRARWDQVDFAEPQEGETFLMDSAYVQKHLPDKRIGVPVRIVGRRAWTIECETVGEGYRFTADFDELRVWDAGWKANAKEKK